jgi:uncharacterized membrane protein YedE/YeeE
LIKEMHLAEDYQLTQGAIGGILLGISASLFRFLAGRISGLSGIVEGMVKVDGEAWQYTYVAGLFLSGLIFNELLPSSYADSNLTFPVLALAGVISGFGTRLAGGCTSGHGLCGLGRFSPRSLTSVLIFMIFGALAASITRSESFRPMFTDSNAELPGTFMYFLPSLIIFVLGVRRVQNLKASHTPSASGKLPVYTPTSPAMHLASFLCSFLFGAGLSVSGMVNSQRVLAFLDFNGEEGWDPTLMSVLCAGLVVTSLSFPYLQKHDFKTVVQGHSLKKILKIGKTPENMVIDWKLVVGSILFGIGWGVSGLCPGPGIIAFGAYKRAASIYFPCLLVGVILKDMIVK